MTTNQISNRGLLLFDQPLSRRTDSVTSFKAAEKLRSSGKWQSQKEMVLSALRWHPGNTSAELAQRMDVERHMPARRLRELERAGLVRRGAVRECRITKNKCLVWWPVKEANLF